MNHLVVGGVFTPVMDTRQHRLRERAGKVSEEVTSVLWERNAHCVAGDPGNSEEDRVETLEL